MGLTCLISWRIRCVQTSQSISPHDLQPIVLFTLFYISKMNPVDNSVNHSPMTTLKDVIALALVQCLVYTCSTG